MSEQDDGGYSTIHVHIRLYHSGQSVVCEGDDMENDPETLDDKAREFDLSGPSREFIVQVRAKRPPPRDVEAMVTVPDDPAVQPAAASVV